MNYQDQTNQSFHMQNNPNYPPTNHYLNSMANQNKGMNPYNGVNSSLEMQQMQQIAQLGQMGMQGMQGMGGMGMLGGLGGLGMPPMNFINDPRRFAFVGDQMTYRVRVESLNEGQMSSLNEVFLNVTGRQVTDGSALCLICTIIWGAFLILPLFLMCFDCWKACVYPSFELSLEFYSSLGLLLRGNVQSLTLIVKDNGFNAGKAQALYQVVSSQRNMLGFTFINVGSGMNYNEREYSRFEQNMKAFKKLPFMTDIRWFREVVLA